MRYMMLIHHDEAAIARANAVDWQAVAAEYAAFNHAIAKADTGFVPGLRLQPSSLATSVRVRNARTEVLDGPYTDIRERFAGYFLIDVPHIDEAIAWATRCPSVRNGSIEIRPVWQQ